MDRPLHVRVDHNKCVGSTICVQLVPRVFELDAHRQAIVVDPRGETTRCIRAAAEQCPLEAIVLEDGETGARIFP